MAEGGEGVGEDAREVLMDARSITSEIDQFVSCNSRVVLEDIDAPVKSYCRTGWLDERMNHCTGTGPKNSSAETEWR